MMKKKKLACVLFATFLLGKFLYFLLCSQLSLEVKQGKLGSKPFNFYKSSNYTMVKSVKDTINILLYTKLWGYHNWRLSNETIDKDSPELVDCSQTNCVFTNNQNYLENVHDYDMLFFHQSPGSWYNSSYYDAIKTRSPHQLYVMAAQEYCYQSNTRNLFMRLNSRSPANFRVEYINRTDIFNITMTYRLDSELEWFYGKMIDIAKGEVVAPAKNVAWRTPDENFQGELTKVSNLKQNK